MELGLLLISAAVIAGGFLGAIVRAWSLSSRLYSAEDRLALLEGIQQREVKIRATDARWRKPHKDEALVEAALAAPPPKQHKLWWQDAAEKLPRQG